MYVDGLGYHDDGEEHLGQALDAYDGISHVYVQLFVTICICV